jgi:hypothetical protein
VWQSATNSKQNLLPNSEESNQNGEGDKSPREEHGSGLPSRVNLIRGQVGLGRASAQSLKENRKTPFILETFL